MKFNYVNTKESPVDWITRGVSPGKFKAQFTFWLHGPSRSVGEALQWPASELGCLSADSHMLI